MCSVKAHCKYKIQHKSGRNNMVLNFCSKIYYAKKNFCVTRTTAIIPNQKL